ncbi:MAG: hypothetical protein KJ674_00520 [Nanoarchaeota archaeon]|nr:hypothetical protein [Nanoarchaeota archaeon]
MEKNKKSILKDKVFYLPIIILALYFIIRLIDQSKIMWIFPFDFTNDISSHMAKIFFLAKYGYHQLVPYWYNGYLLFKFYPPAWFYFTLPLYYLTKNVQIATFISILLIYTIGFIFIYILGKQENISKIKRVAFFLFFFANPLAIGHLLRVGRTPEMFAWLMMIPFIIIIFFYKKRTIDKKFFLLIPFYGLILLSHQTVFIISNTLLLSLILIKRNKKELIKIILIIILTAILTSFWWFPFVFNISESSIIQPTYNFANRLLDFDKQLWVENIISFFIPLTFLILFYFYWIGKKKSKKELMFFLPEIFIAILFLFRLVSFIPLLNFIYPDVYNLFFIFISIFFILKTKFNKKIKKYIPLLLLSIIIVSSLFSIFYTPWFTKNTKLDQETISVFPYIDNKFITVGYDESYGKAFYSYAPIYYNLETPSGWSSQEINKNYLNKIKEIKIQFEKKDCKGFINVLKELNTTYVIAHDDNCNFLKDCDLKEKIKKERVCLYYY